MEAPLLLSNLIPPTPPHSWAPPLPQPSGPGELQGSHGRGEVLPRTVDSLPLLSTWTNTFPCYITEWTEAELSVPSEAACSQNDIMSSSGLLSFHLLPVLLMANYLSVCVSLSALLPLFLRVGFSLSLSSFAVLCVSLVCILDADGTVLLVEKRFVLDFSHHPLGHPPKVTDVFVSLFPLLPSPAGLQQKDIHASSIERCQICSPGKRNTHVS